MGANSSKRAPQVMRETGQLGLLTVCVQGGSKGQCQDSALAVEGILPEYKAAVMAVFDGHGVEGHKVSEFVRETTMQHLKEALDAEETKPRTITAWTAVMNRVFVGVDEALQGQQDISSEGSGSTGVLALRKNDILVVAHVGDSRCVLGRTKTVEGDPSLFRICPQQLTRDHKAGDPQEKVRVKKAGGQVVRWMNAVDRVFVPGKHEPGLAVARAFGDFDLKGHGLIVNPEVRVHDIAPADEFVVLCSDGVWDVMSNEEVVTTIWETKNRAKAAKAVATKAVNAWANRKSSNIRDDISVVVYFFGDAHS